MKEKPNKEFFDMESGKNRYIMVDTNSTAFWDRTRLCKMIEMIIYSEWTTCGKLKEEYLWRNEFKLLKYHMCHAKTSITKYP